MKMLNRYIAFLLLLCPVVLFAGANDNEVLLDQAGDSLNLTIDQIGYGNKLCGTISSGACATDWTLTGNSVTMDIDMIGNLNQIFGPTLFDNTDVDLSLTGNSNIWDWNVGYGGSADASVVDAAISGYSNTFDIDWGYAASSERLNFASVVYSKSPAQSPVKGRPVRLAPVTPGARPTINTSAFSCPKEGTAPLNQSGWSVWLA